MVLVLKVCAQVQAALRRRGMRNAVQWPWAHGFFAGEGPSQVRDENGEGSLP